MRAVVYNRVSSKEQNAALQLRECQEFVASRGWVLDRVFTESASAWKDGGERPVFDEMLSYAKASGVSFVVVWNMDRFSRQPEEEVLELVRMLSVMHNIQVLAVHGDPWSDLVGAVGKLREMGFIGKALIEFLETVIRGLEFARAHRESQVKSDRVRLAVREKDGVTVSYKGKKWGRRALPKQTQKRILELHRGGMSIREIAKTVKYYSKDRERFVSRSAASGVIKDFNERVGACLDVVAPQLSSEEVAEKMGGGKYQEN